MKKLLLFLSFVSMTIIAYAQWEQTGLNSGNVSSFAISGNKIFAGTYSGVYLSLDTGSTWTAVNTGLTNTEINSLAISDTNIFAGTFGGGVFLSTNNGTNWSEVNSGLTENVVFSLAASGTNIFAGTSNTAYLSINNGTSWSAVSTGLKDTAVYSLAVSGTDIYAGQGISGIYKSTNNGSNWAYMSNGLPSDPWVMTLAVSGTTIFAGTGNGVYCSTNNGLIWTEVNNNPSNTSISSLAIDSTNIFAGSYDGVFLFTNNGLGAMVNTGLISYNAYSLIVFGNYIFAGTGNSGVWKRSLSELLGTNELKNNESSIVLYPNPAKDRLIIESLQKSEIEVLSIHGQTILQKQIQQGQTDIDICGLAKGLYILRLNSSDKTEVTRFVKE